MRFGICIAPYKGLRGATVEEGSLTKRSESVSSTGKGEFSGKISEVERTGTPDESGAVFREPEGEVGTRGDIQELGVVVSLATEK